MSLVTMAMVEASSMVMVPIAKKRVMAKADLLKKGKILANM